MSKREREWERVYLSGPITLGDRNHNLYLANAAHKLLLDNKYAVLNPMLTMLHPNEPQIEHGTWLKSDLPWVEVAELVVRLPGTSKGADMEVQHALEHHVEVKKATDIECLRSLFPPGTYDYGILGGLTILGKT